MKGNYNRPRRRRNDGDGDGHGDGHGDGDGAAPTRRIDNNLTTSTAASSRRQRYDSLSLFLLRLCLGYTLCTLVQGMLYFISAVSEASYIKHLPLYHTIFNTADAITISLSITYQDVFCLLIIVSGRLYFLSVVHCTY